MTDDRPSASQPRTSARRRGPGRGRGGGRSGLRFGAPEPRRDDPNAGYITNVGFDDVGLSSDDDGAPAPSARPDQAAQDLMTDAGENDAPLDLHWDPNDRVSDEHVPLEGVGKFMKEFMRKMEEGGEKPSGATAEAGKTPAGAARGTGEAGASKAGADTDMGENESLFYDPDLDDKDAEWMSNMRKSHNRTGKAKVKAKANAAKLEQAPGATSDADTRGAGKDKAGPKEGKPKAGNDVVSDDVQTMMKEMTYSEGGTATDATLSCPACMATLCIDCQQHEFYKSQFRAMFVMNVRVGSEASTSLVRNGDRADGSVFFPVRCAECATEVAVLDTDDFYHFFNVLAAR